MTEDEIVKMGRAAIDQGLVKVVGTTLRPGKSANEFHHSYLVVLPSNPDRAARYDTQRAELTQFLNRQVYLKFAAWYPVDKMPNDEDLPPRRPAIKHD